MSEPLWLYRQAWLRLWPWLPLWLTLALLATFAHGPMPLYSTRTLAVAWEMWTHSQWLVPHLNGQPYSEKVPLLYWLIHAGWFVFGVNNVWPRVLEVGCGALNLVLAMRLAGRLCPQRPQVARATAWLLLGLPYAFLFQLQIMYDTLLMVWVLGALLALVPRAGRAEPRWLTFGLCLGLGLLTKGPVMFLHVGFAWLLGPLWSDWAGAHRRRWYGRGLLAALLGLAVLVLWLVPAVIVGGPDYRHRLLFLQTAARVADGVHHAQPLQAHGRPWWWYLPRLLLLLFPLTLWPRAWAALACLRRPLGPALRFALCWLLPTLAVFSLVRGKQAYYLLPELAGFCLLAGLALVRLDEARPDWGRRWWWQPWPASLLAFGLGLALLVLPNLVARGLIQQHWWVDAARYSRLCGAIVILLGALVLIRGRHQLQRLAVAGVLGAFVFNGLFTLTQWQNYNLAPTAKLLAAAQSEGRATAKMGTTYAGQYHFPARLRQPVIQLQPGQLAHWAAQHPRGVVVVDVEQLDRDALRYAVQVQPFRSDWVLVWRAPVLAALRAGHTPPTPARPARRVPAGYWRYARIVAD